MGHVLLTAYALSATDLDRILVVPAWQHPLEKRATAEYEHRVRMCEHAVRDFERVEVSRIEQRLGGPSRTLYTLQALLQEHPGAHLRLLLGADLLGETPRWHQWEQVEQLAPPLIVGRAGYPRPAECPLELPEVSSTEVRAQLEAGRRTGGLLPRAVEDHIFEHELYRGRAPQ
jgi:nicotinate-nucleotide adenylyltransferase